VPLVIKLPQAGAAEKRIENRVELVDVLPTLLQIAGAAVPAEVQGKSLVGLIKGERQKLQIPGATVQLMRSRIILTSLSDGVRCNRCGPENIYTYRRRGGNSMTRRWTPKRSTIWQRRRRR